MIIKHLKFKKHDILTCRHALYTMANLLNAEKEAVTNQFSCLECKAAGKKKFLWNFSTEAKYQLHLKTHDCLGERSRRVLRKRVKRNKITMKW